MAYALQKQIVREHYDIKGRSPATKLYTYDDKNKDRNGAINYREMPRTSDKSTKSPNFKSNFSLNLIMSAEIGRETTIYSQLTTKNVSADAPAKTTYDWSNTVT